MEELINRFTKLPMPFKVGGIAGIVVLLTVANFFFFVMPQNDTIDNQEKNQRTLDATLAEKTEIAQNLSERRRELEVKELQLQEALTELPERADVDDLLAQLNDEGKKAGLEISRVEPGAESAASFYSRIPIKMQVTGNYQEIAVFLQQVSNMRRIVNINNIRFGTPVVKNDKVTLSSEFLATTFRFLDQGSGSGDKKAAQ